MERKRIIMNMVVVVLALAIAFVVGYGIGNTDGICSKLRIESQNLEKEKEALELVEKQIRESDIVDTTYFEYLGGSFVDGTGIISAYGEVVDPNHPLYGMSVNFIYTGLSVVDGEAICDDEYINTWQMKTIANRISESNYYD